MQEESIKRIHQGQTSQAVKLEVQEVIFKRENDVMNRLIAAHRSGELTTDNLRGSIGEIAGLRSVLEELERSIRRGISETEKVVTNG
jgi:hypothetical protein